jgi:hypothetical protein
MTEKMVMEKQIYKAMKDTHSIKKCYGKFIIPSYALINAINKCGYDQVTTIIIIKRMIEKGYIRPSIDIHGRKWDFTAIEGTDIILGGNFVIQKWVK